MPLLSTETFQVFVPFAIVIAAVPAASPYVSLAVPLRVKLASVSRAVSPTPVSLSSGALRSTQKFLVVVESTTDSLFDLSFAFTNT